MGVCRPVLQILTQFHTPKLTFSTPVFRPGVGRNYVIIKANSDTVRTSTWCSHKWESEIAGVYFSQTTEIYFLKIHLEFAYYSFFLIPLKRQIRSCISSKTIPVFRPKRRKNHILWGTPPPPTGIVWNIAPRVIQSSQSLTDSSHSVQNHRYPRVLGLACKIKIIR